MTVVSVQFVLVTLLISIFKQGTLAAVSSNLTNNKTLYEIPDGGMTKIRCEILLGNTNQTVSWEVDGMLLARNMSTESDSRYFNFNVSGNASLIITNPLLSTTYGLFNVTCIANSTGGITQRIMYQVKLFKAPRITNNQETYDVPEYGSGKINLHCEVEGFPLPVTNWSIGGNILLEGQTYFMNTSKPFNITVLTNGSLRIQSLRRNEAGFGVSVTCIANNSAGSDVNTYLVRFLEAPRITNNQKTYDVPEYGSGKINLHCEVEGFPLPVTNWSIGGNILLKGQTYFMNTSKPFNIAVLINGSLQVQSLRRNEAGFGVSVTCIANNSAGSDVNTYLVRFLEAPRILTNSSNIAILKRNTSTVYIDCETTGYPKPMVEWKFGEHVRNASQGSLVLEVIGHSSVVLLMFGEASYQVFINGTLRVTQTINDPSFTVKFIPYENFTCIACNIAGKVSRTHNFYTGELISYTFEVILLNDEFTGQENNNFKKIRDVFQNDKVYYSITIKAVNSTLRTVYFELTWKEEDLKPDGKLKSTTTIANDVATVLNKVWNITGFELIMDALPGPSTDLIATDVTSSEITFSWKHPKYFKVTRYQIQINHGKGDFKNVNQVSGDKTSATIKDLDADTKYLIKMESINDEGVGEIPSKILHVETKDDVPVTIIVVVVVLVVVVLSGVVLIYLYYRRIINAPDRLLLALGDNPYEFSIPGVTFDNIYVRDNMTYCPTGDLDGSSQQEFFSWKEISRDCLAMGDTLGQGEFGLVVKAMWTEDQSKQGFPVAVKTIKGNATETDRKELFKELKLMADVAKHPNVVNLHGACSKGGPLWVVVEFCEFGNLLGYLKKNRNETSGNDGSFVTSVDPLVRVRIAYDVSKGMRYLEEKKIIHRDLAARNVLLGKNRIAKVSDFGLSRDIYEVGLYQKSTGGKLPVKWMAIESLQEAKYTSKSDIWSFGVLLWEIETAGMVPYPGIPGRDLLGLLQRGLRLDQPVGTEDEIYDLMTTCWQPVAKVRPDFSEIEAKLESYLEERSDYLPVVVDDNDSSGDAYTDYFVEPDEDEPTTSTTSF